MSRRESREKAFMLLYQLEIQKGGDDSQISAFINERDVSETEVEYLTFLVRGVRSQRDELDKLFTPFLKRWTKDRLPKIDLTILRLAAFEMFFIPDMPKNVAISEAVLLCKKYSSEESRSYINAVLGRLSGGGAL
jgi:N utilization substance protein B